MCTIDEVKDQEKHEAPGHQTSGGPWRDRGSGMEGSRHPHVNLCHTATRYQKFAYNSEATIPNPSDECGPILKNFMFIVPVYKALYKEA